MSKLFFIGDSITAGAWDNNGGWANRLIGQIMQKTISANFQDNAFYCLPYNLGVSGDTVNDILRRIETEINCRLDKTNSNESVQIVCAIGVNDSVYMVQENRPRFSDQEFKQNLQNLINTYRKVTENISFIGLTPVDDDLLNPIPWAPEKAYSNKYVQNYEQIINDICHQEQISFYPLFDHWLKITGWKDYLIDGVHPNSKGHEMLAKQIGSFLFTDKFTKFHTA